MRKLFGVWLLLAAGCSTPGAATNAGTQDPDLLTQGPFPQTRTMPAPPPPVPLARVGVEYLPPEGPGLDLAAGPLELATPVETLPDVPPPPPGWRHRPSPEEPRNPAELVASLDLSSERIASVEHPAERLGLRFLREILGGDRRRVVRSLGGAGHAGQWGPELPTTYVDERDQEDYLLRMKRYGTRLLRKPARRALKELSVVNDVEKALDEFKAVHIPLTGAYQKRHDRSHRGRFTMHLGRGSESADPVEIYYLRSGWKIGGGPDHARIAYSKYLTKNLRLRLRSSYGYDDQDVKLLGTVAFEVSPQTTLNLMAGNDMTVLTGPSTYVGTPPEQDRSQAVAFYVEHLF